jgi:hypothetical protein
MNVLKIIGLGIIVWLFIVWLRGPDAELLVDSVAVETVRGALKERTVSFAPLVQKRAPDGAYVVGGIVTANGRDFAFQLRVEQICRAAEKDCYKPSQLSLKAWRG